MANEATEKKTGINALGAKAAYNLANVTKTKPQFGALTPKWLTKFLEFKGLETGLFRVNKVVEGETPLDVLCSQTKKTDIIPEGYVEYETEPREYKLNSISTIINVNTAIEDVYSSPYDQVQEQLGLAIESLRRSAPMAARLRTISTNSFRRSGRNRPSSSPTRVPSPLLNANAPAVACRLLLSISPVASSLPGAAFLSFRPTNFSWTA